MPYLTWLADALRAGGCKVIEQPGWKTRGHGAMGTVKGVLAHHTAGGGSNDWSVVQNGRPGLEGPLAHMTLERDGTFRIIAAGQCWHAGNGTHPEIGTNNGNSTLIGIEGVSRGVGNDWTAAQREAYPKGIAALLRHVGLPQSRLILHREWARPLGRKSDPDGWDGPAMRTLVGSYLRGVAPSSGGPKPSPTPRPTTILSEDEDMQNFPIVGRGQMVILAPTGKASANGRRSWLSASILDGTGSIRVFAQGDDTAANHDWWWNESELQPAANNHLRRPWQELHSGVTKLIVQWDLTKSSGGTLCLETMPTK